MACSDDDPEEPGGSGGKGSGGEDSTASGGAASAGGASGGSGTGSAGSGGSSSGGSSASGGEGNASSGGGSGDSLQDMLQLAEEACVVSYVKGYTEFGELDGMGQPLSYRITEGETSMVDGREKIAVDDLLRGRHELSWELPVADGAETVVSGFIRYGVNNVYSKCFDGIARIRVDGVDGQFYVYASDKLFYADEDGTCLPMAETGYIWGCISDRF